MLSCKQLLDEVEEVEHVVVEVEHKQLLLEQQLVKDEVVELVELEMENSFLVLLILQHQDWML